MPAKEYKEQEDDQNLYISSFEIRDLFGVYSYKITSLPNENDLSRLLILYGDNGTGKTTILKLLYSAISPVTAVGVKTYLAQTPFSHLRIEFNDGICITYSKAKGLLGSMTAEIKSRMINAKIKLKATEENAFPSVHSASSGIDELLSCLSKLEIQCFFLADDRSFQSTTFPSDLIDDEGVAIQNMQRHRPSGHRIAEFREEMQALEIRLAMRRLERWFRDKALRGSDIGEETANTMLLDVIRHISEHAAEYESDPDIGTGIERIASLSKRTNTFTQLGLRPELPAEKIIAIINQTSADVRPALYSVLNPFIAGFEARLDALQEVHDLIELFLGTMNSYLVAKELSYSISGGLRIKTSKGDTLSPANLSSGEKQLVGLLCNSLVARDIRSVFLIDEPELSLNIKWQRQLLDSLLQLTGQTSNQFVIATHSLELLARHSSSVVKLESI